MPRRTGVVKVAANPACKQKGQRGTLIGCHRSVNRESFNKFSWISTEYLHGL